MVNLTNFNLIIEAVLDSGSRVSLLSESVVPVNLIKPYNEET